MLRMKWARTSASCFGEMPIRPSWTLFVFIIWNKKLWIKVSNKCYFSFWKQSTGQAGPVSSPWWAVIFLFLPIHRLGDPEKSLFLLSKVLFTLWQYPKNVIFCFENKITGSGRLARGNGFWGGPCHWTALISQLNLLRWFRSCRYRTLSQHVTATYLGSTWLLTSPKESGYIPSLGYLTWSSNSSSSTPSPDWQCLCFSQNIG